MSQDTDGGFVSYISEKETMEFFCEGLRQASDAAIRLAKAQNHPIWEDISKLMDEMHNQGLYLARSKPLSRSHVLGMLDIRQKKSSDILEASRPKAKPKLIV